MRVPLPVPGIAAALALLALAFAARADTVHKKDGRTVEGELIEENDQQVIVQTRFGPVTVPRSEILRIEKGATPLDQFRERWNNVDRKDVVALLELAEWCEENRLARESKKVYRLIVDIEPDHETAREELGYVKVDGEWASKSDLAAAERKRKEEERKARLAAAKERGAAAQRTAGGDPLAGIGDVSAEVKVFLEPIAANRTADQKLADELEGFFGQRFAVATSEHFSLRAQMTADEVAQHLELAERLYVTCNKLFGLPPEHRLWKGQHVMFHVKQKGTYIDLVDWIDKNVRAFDPEEKKFFKDGGGLISEAPSPLSARLENNAPFSHSIAHWVGQNWIHWYARGGARPWLVEGFAAYTSVNEFGVNDVYCQTNTKYANQVEVADKDSDTAYKLVCTDIVSGRLDDDVSHAWSEMVVRDLNRLDFADLAKSWSLIDFLLRDHGEQLKKYVTTVGQYKDETICLQQVFEWSPDDLDARWKEFVLAQYGLEADSKPAKR